MQFKMKYSSLKPFKDCLREVVSNSEVIELSSYMQHGSTSRFLHCTAVAYYSYWLALLFKQNQHLRELIRASLMHDYYLYNTKTHDSSIKGHGRNHPKIALTNAEKEFYLTDIEREIILKHMFPLTLSLPRSKEAFIVTFIDKVCAVYEFFKRKNAYSYLHTHVMGDYI